MISLRKWLVSHRPWIRSISGKLLLTYVTLLLLHAVLLNTLVPASITRYLTKEQKQQLAHLATDIMNYPPLHTISIQSGIVQKNAQFFLQTISDTAHCEIWIVGKDGSLILVSQKTFSTLNNSAHPTFPLPITDRICFVQGDFHGLLSRTSLTAILPDTEMPSSIAAVLLHYPLSQMDKKRSQLMEQCTLLMLLFYLLSLIMVLAFHLIVRRPLRKLHRAAKLCASFSPSYPYDLEFADEFKDIYENLNYISQRVRNFAKNEQKFVSDLAHDFRSPLTSIKGYSEAMLDGTIPPDRYPRYLNIIMTESIRLTHLTQNLTTATNFLDKKQMLQKSSFNINSMIRATIDQNEIQWKKKKLLIQFHLSDSIANVYADQLKIQQVIYNLLDNAIKFSKPKGTIILTTFQKRNTVYVSVKDFGIGISPDDLSNIWIRFYKSDASRGKDKTGTGLGLSIVREIIHLHDQDITVTSTLGAGSEFVFSLSTKIQ